MRSMVASYLSSQAFRQFLRFCIVGCLNMLVTFIIFYLSYEKLRPMNALFGMMRMWQVDAMGVEQIGGDLPGEGAFANVISYSCGTINSFLLNKKWTFKVQDDKWKQAMRFLVLNLSCLALSTLGIFVFVDIFDQPYKIIWLLTMGLVTVVNFMANKHWTFNER